MWIYLSIHSSSKINKIINLKKRILAVWRDMDPNFHKSKVSINKGYRLLIGNAETPSKIQNEVLPLLDSKICTTIFGSLKAEL